MTLIIVLVVGLAVYYSLRSRLNRLEAAVNDLQKNKVVQPTPIVAPVAPAPQAVPVSTMPYSKPLTEETGGRLLAILGVVAVFIGLAFFLKFAFDNNLIGITTRIVLGYLAGVLAVILGVSLRSRYKEYADTLTGGGIAVLYLVTFAANNFYHLFSGLTVYSVTIVITVLTVAVGVYLASEALVALAFIGAFASPLIMSLYKIDIFPLLGYLLVIGVGNAVVAYWYKWSRLNLIGIIGTFGLMFIWMNSGHLVEGERVLGFLFASLYFVVFLISSMLHHVVRKEISEQLDVATIALNGVFYASAGYSLLNPIYPNAMGYFMLVISVIYFLASLVSFETNREDKLMNIVLPALGAAFLTIAIPIHFNGAAIPVAWIIEALLMFFIEYSVRGRNLYVYGSIVYLIGLINLFGFHWGFFHPLNEFQPFLNERFLLFAFATLAGYAMAYIAHLDSKRGPHETAGSVKIFMAAFAEVVGLALITFEIGTYYQKQEMLSHYSVSIKNTAVSIGWVVYATLLTAFGFAGRYRTLRLGGLVLFFVTAIKIFFDIWAFGSLYRIVASIVFGTLALLASFAYSRFKDRLFTE